MRMSLTRICGPSSSSRFPARQHFAGVGEAARRQVLAHQRLFEHEADGLVIVNDPDRLHVLSQGPFALSTICVMYQCSRHISGQRDEDLEIRPPRHAVALDQAMVLLHEGLRQRQPQAGTALPPETRG
jgi:hypothetical protein